MHSHLTRTAISLCLLMSLALAPLSARAGDARHRTKATLAAMHRWVGTGENGHRWREYLVSDRLEAELAKGADADAGVVTEALGQYTSGANGLDRPRFVAVRHALESWAKELSAPSDADLPVLLRKAKTHFIPVADSDLAEAKSELAASVERLDDYLTPGGENGEAWKKYLRWAKLQTLLGDAAETDLRALKEVYDQFRANHEGLELGWFADVAEALRRYFDFSAGAQTPNAQEGFTRAMEALAASLERYAAGPTQDDHWAIGARLGQLESTSQVPQLIGAVRKRYSHPNLWVQVSSDFLSKGIEREVDRTEPVTDVILRTNISGTGRTTGKVSLRLVPNKNHAVLETVLHGKVVTDTVGENGPVFIYSNAVTKFRASKRMIIDEHGLSSEPATAKAVTESTPHSLSTNKRNRMVDRMIRRIAWKRIEKKHDQADYLAARHAEDRISQHFDEDADEQVAKSNEGFVEKFRNPLLRRGEFPQQLRFSTSEDHLFIRVLQASTYQLGSPGAPPKLSADHELAVRVHESMINNLAAAMLAGRTFTEEGVREAVLEMTGEIPEKLKVKEDEDPWSITFDSRRPISVSFFGGQFQVTIRGRRYTSGERKFQAMSITATYKMEKTDTGTKLIRQGELEIFPPGFDPEKDKLTASQVALRRLLTRRLGEVFEEEIISQERELPGEWAKTGKLRLEQMAADSGWLTLGWKTIRPGRVASR